MIRRQCFHKVFGQLFLKSSNVIGGESVAPQDSIRRLSSRSGMKIASRSALRKSNRRPCEREMYIILNTWKGSFKMRLRTSVGQSVGVTPRMSFPSFKHDWSVTYSLRPCSLVCTCWFCSSMRAANGIESALLAIRANSIEPLASSMTLGEMVGSGSVTWLVDAVAGLLDIVQQELVSEVFEDETLRRERRMMILNGTGPNSLSGFLCVRIIAPGTTMRVTSTMMRCLLRSTPSRHLGL